MNDWVEQVSNATKGDVEAFSRLVARFQDMACGCAYAVLGDFHLAQDAAQEAFLEAYRSLPKLNDPNAFPGWFRRIVLRSCNRLTRRKKLSTVPLETASHVASREADPAARAEGNEMWTRVLETINALPEQERMVTALFYINGYSQKEVAAFLELPVTTVNNRLHASRERLKERMMTMVEDVMKAQAPDEAFARRVAEAIETYAAKGPERDQIGSPWHQRLLGQAKEIVESGEDGFLVSLALSQSDKARARRMAAVQLALHRDERGKEPLERLMRDANAQVRGVAVRAYAELIFSLSEHQPLPACNNVVGIKAHAVPPGIESIIAMLDDEDVKVRWYATLALGTCAELNDQRVDTALRKALSDGSHKVRHAAALRLSIPCPDCGPMSGKRRSEPA